MYDVIKTVPRPAKDVVEALGKIQSATLHEALGKRGALPLAIKPIWPGMRLCGPALTVSTRPGDNLMLHKAVRLAQPGDVLVVENGGFLEAGLWGEIITVAALEKGIAGLVSNGACRDTLAVQALGFPVFCAGVSIKGTTKLTPGKINHPVLFAGVTVHPGDVVVADNDGVVVVPCAEASQALEAAHRKERSEAEIIRQIRAGGSTMDLLGFEEAYARLGLTEEP